MIALLDMLLVALINYPFQWNTIFDTGNSMNFQTKNDI